MISGLIPLSTTDFPDTLSAVLFSSGCPWRCGYCHNAHLIDAKSFPALQWQDILDFLERRRGLLDAVVFSGGEPTLQRRLPSMIKEVRDLGFRIGLHTSGAYPNRLVAVLPDIDWVGMDVKAPFDDYSSITNVQDSGERAKISAMMILESGVDYEFRTTVHPKLLDAGKIGRIAEELSKMGAANYRIQEFRPKGCLDDALLSEPETHVGRSMSDILERLFPKRWQQNANPSFSRTRN